MKIARILAGTGLVGSLLYASAGVILLHRWLGRRSATPSPGTAADEPALRLFKPTTNWDDTMLDRSARWLKAVGAQDQVEILTDDLPPAIKAKAALLLGDTLFELGQTEDLERNPKMLRLAQHTRRTLDGCDWWVCIDHEVEPDPTLLAELHAKARQGEAVWSFPYRFHGSGWPLELDRAAFHLSQWPGIALLQATGQVHFCLGAVMLIPASVIRQLGGFDAFTRCLAEDYQIGRQAARLDIPVGIADHVVTLMEEPMHWRQWWRHQRRMHTTFRHNNPKGYAGSISVMTGFWWWCAWATGLPGGWLVAALLIRLGLIRLSAEIMREKNPARLTLGALPALLVEPVFWGLAWSRGNRVWWRNRWLRLKKGGMIPDE